VICFWSVPSRPEANLYQADLGSAFIPQTETSTGDHAMGARLDILQVRDQFQSLFGENHPQASVIIKVESQVGLK